VITYMIWKKSSQNALNKYQGDKKDYLVCHADKFTKTNGG